MLEETERKLHSSIALKSQPSNIFQRLQKDLSFQLTCTAGISRNLHTSSISLRSSV